MKISVKRSTSLLLLLRTAQFIISIYQRMNLLLLKSHGFLLPIVLCLRFCTFSLRSSQPVDIARALFTFSSGRSRIGGRRRRGKKKKKKGRKKRNDNRTITERAWWRCRRRRRRQRPRRRRRRR